MKKQSGMCAILDQDKRWGITCLMIKCLLDLKPYLEEMANSSVSLTDEEWEQLQQLEAIFVTLSKLKRLHAQVLADLSNPSTEIGRLRPRTPVQLC